MDLQSKIEEIRRKPEHIRRRYVIILVAICMVFVIIFWIFSLDINWRDSRSNQTEDNFINELNDNKQSIKEELGEMNEIKDNLGNILEEDAQGNKNSQ